MSGRRGSARLMRFWTAVSATSGLVPILNVTVIVRLPSALACESKYSRFSTPLICSSSGVATVSEITRGLAPGNWARTTICGGATSGYSDTGRRKIASTPTRKMKIERTPAKRGRSMKKREMSMRRLRSALGRRGARRSGRRREDRHALGIDLQHLGRDRNAGDDALQSVDDDVLAGLELALDH